MVVELNLFFNYFVDCSSRFDLAYSALRLAEKCESHNVMFTHFMLPSSWGILQSRTGLQPYFLPLFTIVNSRLEARPHIYSWTIKEEEVGSVLVQPKPDRLNHYMDVAIYGILVAAGFFSGFDLGRSGVGTL